IPAAEPSFFLSVRFFGIFALIVPAVTAYICIISTFFTQGEAISHYTLANCPEVKSSLPPISYSIGSWEPQKQIWMFAIMLHLPSRMLLTRMVPQIWREGIWQFAAYAAASIECFGLVCVSLFHVDSIAGFQVHAFFFGMWWAGTIWGMSIQVHMQRVTGHIHQDPSHFRLWLLKIFIMTLYIIVSCTTSITYPLSQIYCSLMAFTIFCIGEYLIIALNAAFWAVVLYEFNQDFEGFQFTSVRTKKS
ncbi:hypothetical protein PENTCL1PPCAC_16539, partial [Pristionchus entomophagus]